VSILKNKIQRRARRKKRVRGKIFGTPERPRLSVYRSRKHIYGQIIDDISGHTLATSSTLDNKLREAIKSGGNKEAAAKVGADLAAKALAKNIKNIIFDRNGYVYIGRLKSLAEAARKGGLDF
jgi:large subunit ribosomal protein L18